MATITRTNDLIAISGNRYDVTETADTTTSSGRIVSRTVVPKMRDVTINFSAKGMKPNTRLYAFFEDLDVTRYTKMSYNRANTIAQAQGTSAANVSLFGDIVTDNKGSIEGQFNYVARDFNLPVGIKVFRLTDSQINGNDRTTISEATFASSGQLTIVDKVISTRVVNVSTQLASPATSSTNNNTGTTGADTTNNRTTLVDSGTATTLTVSDTVTSFLNTGTMGAPLTLNDAGRRLEQNTGTHLIDDLIVDNGIASTDLTAFTGDALTVTLTDYIDNNTGTLDHTAIWTDPDRGTWIDTTNSDNNIVENLHTAIRDYVVADTTALNREDLQEIVYTLDLGSYNSVSFDNLKSPTEIPFVPDNTVIINTVPDIPLTTVINDVKNDATILQNLGATGSTYEEIIAIAPSIIAADAVLCTLDAGSSTTIIFSGATEGGTGGGGGSKFDDLISEVLSM